MVSKLNNQYNDPDDCRTWFYVPRAIPENEDGYGPVPYEECVNVRWEVWDQSCTKISSHEQWPDALNRAIEENKKLGHYLNVNQILDDHPYRGEEL